MIMSGNKTEKSVADHLLTADVDPLRSHLHIAVGEIPCCLVYSVYRAHAR